MLYESFLRPILFSLTRHDPEVAHERAMLRLALVSRVPAMLALMHRTFSVPDPKLARTVCGLHFPNPVGLAGGFDKDGIALPALAALGFGFLEIGTVTWHGQPGNPRPRVFRMPGAGALINRMGFNNQGAMAMANRLERMPEIPVPVGISLGKSRITLLEEAVEDYCASLRTLYPYGDFFTVNVSSPNTPGLRMLQERAHLTALLSGLQREIQSLANAAPEPACSTTETEAKAKFNVKLPFLSQLQGRANDICATTPWCKSIAATKQIPPLLVKIAPDLTEQAIGEVLEVCAECEVNGIIATNTLPVGTGCAYAFCESGGMSGKPLAQRARDVVSFISRETSGFLPIIGVGGIFNADDARRMLDAGASLVQIYTGFIYGGPMVVRAINRGLAG